MFIYEVTSYFYVEQEMDNIYTYNYLMHEKEFTKEEFDNMCREGIDIILDKNSYELSSFLRLNFGFQPLVSTQSYEFEEE